MIDVEFLDYVYDMLCASMKHSQSEEIQQEIANMSK
jgi:hypothetical protein